MAPARVSKGEIGMISAWCSMRRWTGSSSVSHAGGPVLLRGPDARAGGGCSSARPVGTVRTRLTKGRERLRSRLLSRGLAPTAGLLAATGGGEASAGSIPTALAVATVRAALLHAAASIAGVVPASAAAMAERGLKMMSLTRWKAIAFTLMTIGGGTPGVVAFAQSRQQIGQGEVRPSGGTGGR